MTALLIITLWLVVAIAVGLLVGKSIRSADRGTPGRHRAVNVATDSTPEVAA